MDAEYTMVAEARGQRVLWFRRFGSYQGEWLLLSRTDDRYFIYKDWYGSCSGCDSIEATWSHSQELEPDDPKVQEFIEGYRPFLEMTPRGALNVAQRDDNLLKVMPANMRSYEWDPEAVGYQLALVVKHEEGVITAREIIELDNQEIRREALEKFGADLFVRDLDAKLIDSEGDDHLYFFFRDEGPEPFVFLYLKDASTDRRYILRTHPQHRKVREARAASFGIPVERFDLVQET